MPILDPIAAMDPVGQYRLPRQALQVTSKFLKLSMWGRVLDSRIPLANEVARRLAWHLTPEMPHPVGVPMMQTCLANAYSWAEATMNDEATTRTDTVLVAFLAGLLYPTPALQEIQAYHGRHVWNPYRGKALCALAVREEIRFEFIEPPGFGERGFLQPRQVRHALLAHLLDPPELAKLQHHLGEICEPGVPDGG